MESLLPQYGYVAVFLLVAIESMGIPMPGETILIAASVYAGTTHNLNIILIIAAASLGAVVGDNIGYWIGRKVGFPILTRFGKYLGLNEKRLKIGHYLFYKYGGGVVFWGRFVSVLRVWAAFLAGVNEMRWRKFLIFNMAGGILWATFFGTLGYYLGKGADNIAGPLRSILVIVGVALILGGFLYFRRHERKLSAEAEKLFPNV